MQHNGKLLLRVLCCEDIADVLSDVTLIWIGISWDSLIHCWRTRNVRLDDMMGVMTLFEDDQGGCNPPWWPEPSSRSCSVQIKGYSVDVVVSCVLRNVHLVRLYLMGVTAVAGVMVSVATLTHLGRGGGDRLEHSGWLPIVMQWAGLMAPTMSAWLPTVVFFYSGEPTPGRASDVPGYLRMTSPVSPHRPEGPLLFPGLETPTLEEQGSLDILRAYDILILENAADLMQLALPLVPLPGDLQILADTALGQRPVSAPLSPRPGPNSSIVPPMPDLLQEGPFDPYCTPADTLPVPHDLL